MDNRGIVLVLAAGPGAQVAVFAGFLSLLSRLVPRLAISMCSCLILRVRFICSWGCSRILESLDAHHTRQEHESSEQQRK